jgi:succinoglycan biosynthesis transport protein ExoP
MNDTETNISEIGVTLKRQFKTIVYTIGPVLALIVGIAFGLPDLYRSTGVIRIEQNVQGDNRAVDTYAEYLIETLTEQVFTDENLGSWIDEYGVYAEEPGWSDAKRFSVMRDNINTTIVTTTVIDPRTGREREVVTGFEVSFDSRKPELAHRVAGAAVEAFLLENRRSREVRGMEEIEFFETEVERYRAKMAEVEARLADFKELNARKLPDLMQVNMSAMDRVERDLEAVQLQMDNLKRERVILQSQLSQIPSTSDGAIQQLAELQSEYVRVSSIYQDTHPTVVSIRKQIDLLSQSVDSAAAIPFLRRQQEEIAVALAAARDKYSGDHPYVRQLIRSETAINDRIAALADGSGVDASEVVSTNELYVQLDTQIKTIDAEASGLNARVDDLRQKRQEYEDLLLQTPQVDVEYQDLLRDLENARNLYEETQEQQRKAELALALARGSQGEQLVLAKAPGYPKSPSWPPRAAIVILGVILAIGAGIGIATLRATSSGTVNSSRDVFELCGMPPIALIPMIYNRQRRIRQKLYAVSFLVVVGIVGSLAFVGVNGFID